MRANALTKSLLVSALTTMLAWAGGAYADASVAEALQPLDCVINPSIVADLGSGVPGILSTVNVDRSDLVEQGQVVAELESSVETLALELARARAEMDAEIDLRRVNAAFGQRQHQRTEDLYRRKVISTNDMDERKTEARLAALQLRQALENQHLAVLEEQRAEKVLHRRAIQSPITGVVMERFKTIGEYVEDQPVLRVAQLDPLYVEVFVPVERLGEVTQGMHAQVWSESVPGTNWEAKVSRVDRVADVASGTYGVRLELPNPDYTVPAGLRCRLQFVAAPEPAVTQAPSEPAGDEPQAAPLAESAQPVAAEKYSRADAILAGLARAAEREATASVQIAGPVTPPETQEAVESLHDDDPAEAEVARAEPEFPVEPQAAEPRPVAKLPPVAEVAALPRCQLAGPFGDEATAGRKADALRAQGLEVKVEERSTLVQKGLRVLSEQLVSRAAALALQQRLQAAGIKDLYVVTRGQYADRVALGLYKNERPAQERVDQLTAMGFRPEIRPWLAREDQYFLAVRGVPSAEGAKVLGALPVAATDGSVEKGTCEQLASR